MIPCGSVPGPRTGPLAGTIRGPPVTAVTFLDPNRPLMDVPDVPGVPIANRFHPVDDAIPGATDREMPIGLTVATVGSTAGRERVGMTHCGCSRGMGSVVDTVVGPSPGESVRSVVGYGDAIGAWDATPVGDVVT